MPNNKAQVTQLTQTNEIGALLPHINKNHQLHKNGLAQTSPHNFGRNKRSRTIQQLRACAA
jgi:hypothetical protein